MPDVSDAPAENLSRQAGDEPSPPGRYKFAGRIYRYDYGRIVARLGKVPDAALAREISMPSTAQLHRFRRQLGLPAADRAAGVLPYLGTQPDTVLARAAGCAPATIAARRRARGIPKYHGSKRRADDLLREYVKQLEAER